MTMKKQQNRDVAKLMSESLQCESRRCRDQESGPSTFGGPGNILGILQRRAWGFTPGDLLKGPPWRAKSLRGVTLVRPQPQITFLIYKRNAVKGIYTVPTATHDYSDVAQGCMS